MEVADGVKLPAGVVEAVGDLVADEGANDAVVQREALIPFGAEGGELEEASGDG